MGTLGEVGFYCSGYFGLTDNDVLNFLNLHPFDFGFSFKDMKSLLSNHFYLNWPIRINTKRLFICQFILNYSLVFIEYGWSKCILCIFTGAKLDAILFFKLKEIVLLV